MGFWGAQFSDKPSCFNRKFVVCFLFFSPVDKFSGCYLPEGSKSGSMTLRFLTLINIVYEDNRIEGTCQSYPGDVRTSIVPKKARVGCTHGGCIRCRAMGCKKRNGITSVFVHNRNNGNIILPSNDRDGWDMLLCTFKIIQVETELLEVKCHHTGAKQEDI